MSTCVTICTDDDGNVTVGLSDPPSDTSDMQPAKSVQDALAMAKHLLTTSPAGAQTGDQAAGGPSGTQPGNGMGGGTGPDSQGSTVTSTQDAGAAPSGSQDPQAIWDALAQMNMPQN